MQKEPIKNKKEDDGKDFPGYPLYPANEDIYAQAERAEGVHPGEEEQTTDQEDRTDKWNEKGIEESMTGEDLDVPGSELDDAMEKTGDEDEENNYYSLGGDNHDN